VHSTGTDRPGRVSLPSPRHVFLSELSVSCSPGLTGQHGSSGLTHCAPGGLGSLGTGARQMEADLAQP
jgi:hypothetical protein